MKTLERKWSTPVPQAGGWDELNDFLRQCCLRERDRLSTGKTETIGARFEHDKRQAAALPKHRFDPCVRQAAKVNKYQFARFDNVNYSVPRYCAFETVTVKGYVDRVEIVLGDAVAAVHRRSYDAGDQVLDPLHYLAALGRRPAALDHANVYRRWKLPAVFDELRARLEERHGARGGVRQYVRVLQLLAEHPLERVQQSIEQLRGPEGADADRIIRRVERLAASARERPESSAAVLGEEAGNRSEVLQVQVPCPGLDHFDLFLSSSTQGGDDDAHVPEERSPAPAPEGEPQAPQAADHACGV